MASTGSLWWMTPLQCFATIGAAVNLGGSVMQSPLIMPIFQIPDVPARIASLQVAKLLHDSEYFFPPLNMACTLSNLALTTACYLNRNGSPAAAEKLPWTAAAFACSVATTAYAVLIMLPRNRRMTFLSVEMNKHMTGGKDEREFRQIQSQWRKLNYGRATLMLGNALASMYAVLL